MNISSDIGKPEKTDGARPRLVDIDRAKGLAILLVVFGHLVMRDHPDGSEWYNILRTMIYKFHMPFFMYLSGIVMFYTGAARTPLPGYADYLRKRAERLLAPFFLLGLLIYFGKMAAGHFMHVENTGMGIGDGLLALLWDTHRSPATSIWYVFVLFIYSMAVPLLLALTRQRLWPLFILSLVLYILPAGDYIYADKICHFFVFFVLGGISAVYSGIYKTFTDSRGGILLAAFTASLFLIFTDLHWLAQMAVIGTLSLPALHFLVRRHPLDKSDILLSLGKYCFVIYLFNTIFIGFTKGIMLHFISWQGPHFLLFVPVLFCAGVLGPVALKLYVLKHVKYLDKITA